MVAVSPENPSKDRAEDPAKDPVGDDDDTSMRGAARGIVQDLRGWRTLPGRTVIDKVRYICRRPRWVYIVAVVVLAVVAHYVVTWLVGAWRNRSRAA